MNGDFLYCEKPGFAQMPPQTFSFDAVVAFHPIFGMFVGGCTQPKLSLSCFGSLAHFILVCYKQAVETLRNLWLLGLFIIPTFFFFLNDFENDTFLTSAGPDKHEVS